VLAMTVDATHSGLGMSAPLELRMRTGMTTEANPVDLVWCLVAKSNDVTKAATFADMGADITVTIEAAQLTTRSAAPRLAFQNPVRILSLRRELRAVAGSTQRFGDLRIRASRLRLGALRHQEPNGGCNDRNRPYRKRASAGYLHVKQHRACRSVLPIV
jgi:hypothetical protein